MGPVFIAMIRTYVEFLGSWTGGPAAIAGSALSCIVIATWAWRSKRPDLRALLITAGVLTLAVVAGFVEGTRFGWWGGMFVHYLPPVVQIAILFPVVLLGWLVWIGGYCWLTSRVSHPRLLYLMVGILLVLAAAAADRAELSQGLIDVGDGQVWFHALLFVAMMFGPVLVYDLIRHSLERDLLP